MKHIESILHYFKRWNNDYTLSIYILKIFGIFLTAIYFAVLLFDTNKIKNFNKKNNFFLRLRKWLILRYEKPIKDEFNRKFLRDDKYDFNGIFLPKIENIDSLRYVYEDTLKVYTEKNDDYSYKIVDKLDETLPEGTYCYSGPNGEDITIKSGYTVIDAGAWIGDFSAYASKKGAHVFAFEPSPNNIKLLEKTIDYNKNNGGSITIAPFGLGEKEEILEFYENAEEDNSGGNSFNVQKGKGNIQLSITTLDTWVEKNNVKKVDFIKSDIEGYERHMLRGAVKTLRDHAPILSICTYHLPDDRKVLKEIILQANPKYKIIQRKMKLFAFVEK